MNRQTCRGTMAGRVLGYVSITLVAISITGCGGGDDEMPCATTAGVFPLAYTPSDANDGGYSVLNYVRGEETQWTLEFRGTTAACKSGLRVSETNPLPAGFSLDSNTGTIHMAKDATGETGFCIKPDEINEWQDGVCPAGYSAVPNGYSIEVSTPGLGTPTVTVSFVARPAP